MSLALKFILALLASSFASNKQLHKSSYKLGAIHVTTQCDINPDYIETKFSNCKHKVKSNNRTYELKGGEKVERLRFSFFPKRKYLLATFHAACCGESSYYTFYTVEGKRLGQGSMYLSSAPKEVDQNPSTLKALFVGKDAAFLYQGKQSGGFELVSSELQAPPIKALVKDKKKLKLLDIHGLSLPVQKNCSWFQGKVGSLSTIRFFAADACTGKYEGSEIAFSCKKKRRRIKCKPGKLIPYKTRVK